ncbi:hypothetical protein IAT38_001578 [Cryptococcus sp. DSM 104549]
MENTAYELKKVDGDSNVEGEQDVKAASGSGADVTVSPTEDSNGGEDGRRKQILFIYDGVQRRLEQRHMQMIALAGTLGSGLFLGSGKTIAYAGPVGALLAYILVGTVSWSMLMSLGEMACYAPISGGYIHFAERWLHPAVGFALGYQVIFMWMVALPAELISCSILMSLWDIDFPASHQAAYLTALCVVCASFNYLGVRWFGEAEFIFAMLKIALVVGLILAGLIVDLGGNPLHDRIGFRYWKDPGAFAAYYTTGNEGKFLGWFTSLVQAAYSYVGMEQLGVTAAEVKNPRVAVAKACKKIFYRIAIFYVLSIWVIGMLVPYTDENLLQGSGNAAGSPFVIAFNRVGIKVLPHIINAILIVSSISTSNMCLYGVSRMIYGLGVRGHAPKIFGRTTKKGLPLPALVVATLCMGLCYMCLGSGAATAFTWFSNITSLSGFITWGVISVTYLRFKAGLKAQGIDRKSFHYYNRFQPLPAYWTIFWASIVVIFNGWEVFTRGSWDTSSFFVSYVNIPFFIVLCAGYQIVKRPRWLKSEELDFVTGIPSDAEVYYEEPAPKTWVHRWCNILFT